METLNDVLSQYQGFHYFHNFTDISDPEVTREVGGFRELDIKKQTHTFGRIVLSCRTDETVEINGEEFYKISIVGTSFLRYQVRKMMGVVIHILRGNLPPDFLNNTLQTNLFVPTPRAPGTNLIKASGGLRDRQHSGHIVNFQLPNVIQRQEEFIHEMLYPEIASNSKDAFARIDQDGAVFYKIPESKMSYIRIKSEAFIRDKQYKDDYLHEKDKREESRLLPRRFVINYMVQFDRVPSYKNDQLIRGLEDAIESGEIEAMQDYAYYFDYIEKTGEETLIQRGKEKKEVN